MPAGRPTLYTEDLADLICERLMVGFSLRQICDAEGMPDRITVIRWMHKHRDFATKCADARDEQADLMDDRIIEVADKCERGELKPDAARVVLSALQWRAEKLKPKKYGNRTEITGRDGKDLIPETDSNDLARRIAFILSQARPSDVKD